MADTDATALAVKKTIKRRPGMGDFFFLRCLDKARRAYRAQHGQAIAEAKG